MAVRSALTLQLDIATYLLGARHLVDGRLYEVSLPVAPHLPFTYPPFAALAFGPLALLPARAAQVVWSLVGVAALVVLVLASLRAACPALDRRHLVQWSLVLTAPAYLLEPVRLTFFFGQVNVVLAAMVLVDLTARPRIGGRTLPRGVLVGLAAAVKLVPLVFVPYLFVTRQTRAAWTALATFAACTVVATLVDPSVSWSYWTRYATDARRVGAPWYLSDQSLRAFADRLDHRAVSTAVVTGLEVLVVIAGIALAAWAFRASSNLLGVLVCATTGLLASPISWAHHLVWVVPVLVWLVWAPDRPAGGRVWAAVVAALFWWGPIWSVPSGGNRELHESAPQLVVGDAFFIAMVVFLAGVALLLLVRRRVATRPELTAGGRPGATAAGTRY
jgi:alpha-1,2-mannosyltransferase